MLKQTALIEALRAWPGPESAEQRKEREARQRKRLADLKADADRQLRETLESISAQLSAESRRLLASLSDAWSADDLKRLRIASALLQADGLPKKPYIAMLVALLTDDEAERADALRRLAGRYNVGRQSDAARWGRAKQAWLEAHRRGRPRRAIADAMAAGGFKKSAVYERARRENWSAQLSR